MAVNETVGINLVADTKSLRSQLREATQELAKLQNSAGASAAEIAKAAKRAAELRDRIGDAKDTIDAFNPDAKFRAFSASITGVAGAFAGLQGALGLFGSESENVQKQLLKVQSALALSEGLNTVFSSIDAFKNLGLVIKTNLITGFAALRVASVSAFTTMRTVAVATFTTIRGALIASGVGLFALALGLIVANFNAIKESLFKLFPGLKEFAGLVGGLIDKFAELTGITNKAEEALDKYIKTSARKRESLEQELRLLEASGATEETLYKKKKQIINSELQDYREKLKVKKTLTEEELKDFRKLKVDLEVLDIEFAKNQKDEAAKKKKEDKDESIRLGKEAYQRQKAINEQAAKLQREAALSLLDQQTRELKEREDKYQEDRKTILKSNNKDLTNLNKAYEKDLLDIKEKYIKERLDAEKKALEDGAKALDEFYKGQEEKEKLRLETSRQLSFEEIQNKIVDIDRKNELLETDFQEDILRLENKKTLLEEAKNLELSNTELTAAERLKITRDYADKEISVDKEITASKKAEASARQAINDAYLGLALQFGNALTDLAGENKELAIAGVVISQAAAIGQIISQTGIANAKAVAASPITGGMPWVAINTASAALSIASSIKAGVTSINQIKNPKSGTVVNAGLPAPVRASYTPAAPTELDQKSLNSIQNVVARAYVVESDITGSQKRIKRIENAARI
jgi:hypothetical protein